MDRIKLLGKPADTSHKEKMELKKERREGGEMEELRDMPGLPGKIPRLLI